jgi:small ligand-binding sensory domain FIST
MRIAAAAANRGRLDRLLDQVLEKIVGDLEGASPDLGLLFLTNHFEDEAALAAERIRHQTGVRTLLGCTGEGVLGPEGEMEREPALSVWLASLPGAQITPFRFDQAALEAIKTPEGWGSLLQAGPEEPAVCLMLGDPFSVDVNSLLAGCNQHLPGWRVCGGMASGAESPGQAVLLLNDASYRDGMIGLHLGGAVKVDTVVSQGCRPIGRPFVVTKAERNVISELGGQPPLGLLQQIFQEAPTSEQALMRQGVFLGRVINEMQPEFHRGDFLIRNLMGADDRTGAIAVGDLVRRGITVQFHVRDAETASEDLRALLTTARSPALQGGLLFSCNGRGTRMFPHRDHDIGMLRDVLGPIPTAGFFCGGELGPVGGKNFIHGHTASIVLFQPA